MNGPIAQEPVLSLALREKQGAAPLEIAQVDVVAERGADDGAGGVDDEDDLGLGVVPGRAGMEADLGAAADRGHRLRTW